MQVSEQQLAAAFDQWMQEYTEHPDRFEREWQDVGQFLEARRGGEKPTYGPRCAVYLLRLLKLDLAFAGPGSSAAPPAASA